jgi:zinc ribbon protein
VHSSRAGKSGSVPEQPTNCPTCDAPVPKGAAFCPACGTRIDAGETARAEVPLHETGPVPVTMQRVSPRWFGVTPPTLLFGVVCAVLVLAVVLLAGGHWISGLLVLGLALLLAAAFLEVGRRKPDAAVVKASVDAVDSLRARAGFAAHAMLTTSAARKEIGRRRAELARLHSEREALFRGLGEAVYAGEDGAEQRARIAELDERGATLEAEAAEIAQQARAKVEKAQLEVQSTEVVQKAPDE